MMNKLTTLIGTASMIITVLYIS